MRGMGTFDVLFTYKFHIMETKNIIVEKSLAFGVAIVRFSELLEEARKYVVAKQILRCGISIGANIFEAQHAESRSDLFTK